jgi:uncharacterized protein (UPF0332 family)
LKERPELLEFKSKCALETLADADTLILNSASARSIVNRSYYAMFYAVLTCVGKGNGFI